jgi:hypothetical protein
MKERKCWICKEKNSWTSTRMEMDAGCHLMVEELENQSLPVVLNLIRTEPFAILNVSKDTKELDLFVGKVALVDSRTMELFAVNQNLTEEELEVQRKDLTKKRKDFCGIQSAKRVIMLPDAVFALPIASTE